MIRFLAGDTIELIEEFMYDDGRSLPIGTTGQVVEDSGLNTTRVSFGETGKMWLLSDTLKLIAHHPDRVRDTMTTSADSQPAPDAGRPAVITAAEFVALTTVSENPYCDYFDGWTPIYEKGLVGIHLETGYKVRRFITPLGRVILAQATPQPATAGDGEAVGHCVDCGKPTTSTWYQSPMCPECKAKQQPINETVIDNSPLTTEERLMLAVEGNTLLQAQIASLHRELATVKAALREIQSLAQDGQGEWAPVDPVYALEWTHLYSDIESRAAKALTAATDTPQPATAGDGEAVGFYTELQALLAKYGESTEVHAALIGTSGDIDGGIPIESRCSDSVRAIYLMSRHVEATAIENASLQSELATAKAALVELRLLCDRAADMIGDQTLLSKSEEALGQELRVAAGERDGR